MRVMAACMEVAVPRVLRKACVAAPRQICSPFRPICTANASAFALRECSIDLHSAGNGSGPDGASLRLVLPKDWRDIPHTPDNPPFWAVPWPSGTALAGHLLGHPELVGGKRVCDLGCGLGTGGLAALHAGASEVALVHSHRLPF